jgi:hypothetical protein
MGEFNVDKTTGGLNPTAGMPDTYPAEQVMMSDGVTSVEDALDELIADKIIYVRRQVTNFQLQNEWWGNYIGEVNTDISSLALQNIPTIVSAIFVPSVSGTAWVTMNPSTKTNISVILVSPKQQATVTGEIIIGIKSNG